MMTEQPFERLSKRRIVTANDAEEPDYEDNKNCVVLKYEINFQAVERL